MDIDWGDSELVSSEIFDDYRCNHYDPNDSTPSPRFFIKNDMNSGLSKARNLAYEFQKGIRRDKTHYSVLEDEEKFEDWKCKTIATIASWWFRVKKAENQENWPIVTRISCLVGDRFPFRD